MENLNVTIKMTDAGFGGGRNITQILINEQEIEVKGITLNKLLTNVEQEGWSLGRATMQPRGEVAVLSYYYQRSTQPA